MSDHADLINNLLNDDCLEKIFEFLTVPERLAAESVCRRWKAVSKPFWKNTEILEFGQKPFLEDLTKVGFDYQEQYATRIMENCGQYVNKFVLDYPYSGDLLFDVADLCPNLTRLEIDSSYYPEDSTRIFSKLENLTYLRISIQEFDFPVHMLEAMPRENLTELHLVTNTFEELSSRYFADMKNLKALTVQGFRLPKETTDTICEYKNLSYLNLTNTQIHYTGYMQITKLINLKCLYLSFGWLESISHNCQQLETLSFINCWHIYDQELPSLRYLKNLRKLEIIFCPYISNDPIINVIELIDNLEVLKIHRCECSAWIEDLVDRIAPIVARRNNGRKFRLVVDEYVAEHWIYDEMSSPFIIIEGFDLFKIMSDRLMPPDGY